MKIKCLIIDDEPIAQEIIENYISQISFLTLKGKCDNAIQALDFLRKESIDLLFLDIEMPQISGLSFLRTLKNPPLTIITTAFREFALEGFELDVLDYLLKPISFERFLKSVNKIYKFKKYSDSNIGDDYENGGYIYIKNGYKKIKLNRSEIIYLEKDGNYITYFTINHKELSRQTAKEALNELGSDFIQVHKSYIVNLSMVKSYDNNYVYINNLKFPLGQSYKLIFIEKFAGMI